MSERKHNNTELVFLATDERIHALISGFRQSLCVTDFKEIEAVVSQFKQAIVLFSYERFTLFLPMIKNAVNNKIRGVSYVCVADGLRIDERIHLVNHATEHVRSDFVTDYLANFRQSAPRKGRRILLVEDDRSQALFAERILYHSGYKVSVALNEKQAIAWLKQQPFDLVLMDMYLEETDGCKITEIIRRKFRLQIPIVMLTSEYHIDVHIRAVNAGADDMLAKPINQAQLIAVIENKLNFGGIYQTCMRINAHLRNIKAEKLLNLEASVVDNFLDNELTRKKGALVWISINNHKDVQKTIGFSARKNLCFNCFSLIRKNITNAEFVTQLSEHVMVIGLGYRNIRLINYQLDELVAKVNHSRYMIMHFNIAVQLKIVVLDEIEKTPREHVIPLVTRLLNAPETDGKITRVDENALHDYSSYVYKEICNALWNRQSRLSFKPIKLTDEDVVAGWHLGLNLKTGLSSELRDINYVEVAQRSGLLPMLEFHLFEEAVRCLISQELNAQSGFIVIRQSLEFLLEDRKDQNLLKLAQQYAIPANALVLCFEMEEVLKYRSYLKIIRTELLKSGIISCVRGFVKSEDYWDCIAALDAKFMHINPDKTEFSDKDFSHTIALINTARERGLKMVLSGEFPPGISHELIRQTQAEYVVGAAIV